MIHAKRFIRWEIVKLAVAGRNKKFNCISVKHNFFIGASGRVRLTSIQTHTVLFESPRDLQQIDHLGRQLMEVEF